MRPVTTTSLRIVPGLFLLTSVLAPLAGVQAAEDRAAPSPGSDPAQVVRPADQSTSSVLPALPAPAGAVAVPAGSTTVRRADAAQPAASGGGVAIPQALSAGPLPGTDDAEILRLARTMPLDSLEAMLDAYVGLKNEDMVLAIAAEILRKDPSHCDALRESVGVTYNRKDAARCRELSERFATVSPNDPEAHECVADAWLLDAPGDKPAERSGRVVASLTRVKALRPADKFDRQQDLASAYEEAGDWKKARDAWSELALSFTATPELRTDSLDRIDDIETNHLAAAYFGFQGLTQADGKLWSLDQQIQNPINGEWTGFVSGHEDWISDQVPSGYGLKGGAERQEAMVGARGSLGNGWVTEVRAGIQVDRTTRPAAAVSLTRTLGGGAVIGVDAAWNERATDGLPLIWDAGRQNRAGLHLELPFTTLFTAEVDAFYREVKAGDVRLGDGGGVDASFAWNIIHDPKPLLSLGYEWEWRHFSYDSGAGRTDGDCRDLTGDGATADAGQSCLRDLVLDRVNRHRIFLTGTREFGAFTATLRLTGGYRFEEDKTEYGGGAALAWRMNEHIKLSANYQYDSSSQTGLIDGDSHLFSLTCRYSF